MNNLKPKFETQGLTTKNMVKLADPFPGVVAEGTEAAKSGYNNICKIGKERIRRAGERIKEETGLLAQNLDMGFRVLKLDETNKVI